MFEFRVGVLDRLGVSAGRTGNFRFVHDRLQAKSLTCLRERWCVATHAAVRTARGLSSSIPPESRFVFRLPLLSAALPDHTGRHLCQTALRVEGGWYGTGDEDDLGIPAIQRVDPVSLPRVEMCGIALFKRVLVSVDG